jgi:hypothetical protein
MVAWAEELPNKSPAHTALSGKAHFTSKPHVTVISLLFPVLVRVDDHSTLYSKIFPMADSSRYVFVNGPDIASSNSKYDGRTIRSAMMRRTLREKQQSSKPRLLSLKWIRICQCRPAEASSSLQHACGLRRLLPGVVGGTISGVVCLLCGGSSGSRPAIEGIEKRVSASGLGRVDPFTSSGHVVDGLRYDEMAHYCT